MGYRPVNYLKAHAPVGNHSQNSDSSSDWKLRKYLHPDSIPLFSHLGAVLLSYADSTPPIAFLALWLEGWPSASLAARHHILLASLLKTHCI